MFPARAGSGPGPGSRLFVLLCWETLRRAQTERASAYETLGAVSCRRLPGHVSSDIRHAHALRSPGVAFSPTVCALRTRSPRTASQIRAAHPRPRPGPCHCEGKEDAGSRGRPGAMCHP